MQARRRVLRLETLSEADGQPLSRATSYFDAARFAGIESRLCQETRSITAVIQGIRRRRLFPPLDAVSARHADAADLADLRLSPGAIVLVTVAVNEDPAGIPVEFSESRFAASRIEFSIASQS